MQTTTEPLTRTAIIEGMVAEYRAFAELVRGLDAAQWSAPTRCEGFEVRDVAGHVIGLAEDVAAGVPGSRTAEEEAATVRGDAPAAAAGRLDAVLAQVGPLAAAFDDDDAWAAPSGAPDLTLGEGVLTLWYDTFVHADDIRAALGQPSAAGPGLTGAVSYLRAELAKRGYGPARVVVTMPDASSLELAIGSPAGDDTPVVVDAHAFVLAATGRTAAGPLGLDDTVNIYAG